LADDQMPHLLATSTLRLRHGDYLDGNVIRTAVMYADMRSGLPPLPFTPGAGVGWRPRIRARPDGCSRGEQPIHAKLQADFDRTIRRFTPWDGPD